ncbi:MAG: DMT family protein [Marinilabiliaceae bacterium]|nr:DMT family protein [Marinilabiliaceae bacterium]
MAGFYSILLLILSNTFMTFAWYGHLRFGHLPALQRWGLLGVIVISWGIAFFEYCCQVPANRIGFIDNGGPFSLIQLKVIQEVVSLSVFTIFTLALFPNEQLRWNHIIGFIFLVLAVYFIFKK